MIFLIDINTRLNWYGDASLREIRMALYSNLKDACKAYFNALKIKIGFQGAKGDYSQPGSPPYKQSRNLYNSIVVKSEKSSESMRGEISTDVPYAPILEFGGMLQLSPDEHIHASKTPEEWGKAISIAPRPAWIPTFEEELPFMLEQLTQSNYFGHINAEAAEFYETDIHFELG